MKRILTIGFAAVLAWSQAYGKHPKLAKDLENNNPDATVDVIVQFKQTPTDAHHAKVHSNGGKDKARLDLIKSGAYSMPAGEVQGLADDPEVAYISPDRPVHGALDNAVPAIGADIARSYGWDGKDIGVAIIDSGIHDTADLAGRIAHKESLLPSERNADDEYGHGTHVAGIIAGNGSKSDHKYLGVAPKVKLVCLRVLDDHGRGQDSFVIAAIQKAIELKKKHNIRVLNLSLGRPIYESFRTDPLCQAVEVAWKAGIVVVVAAGNEGRNNSTGNDGYGTIASPANDPYVITVGSMKSQGTPSRGDDLIASYSSKGPTTIDFTVKPDLVAPGNLVVAAQGKGLTVLEQTFPANVVAKEYLRLSGTSVAASMVSGAVALLLDKEPTLTPDQVKARLMKSASKNFPMFSVNTDPVTCAVYRSQYDIFTIGAGYLDIMAALMSTETPLPGARAVSPLAVFDPQASMIWAVADPTPICSNSAVWGSSAVWGTSAVWGSSGVWGTSAV